MLSQQEFTQFIGEIVESEFPSEKVSFQLGGSRSIGRLYESKEPAKDVSNSQEMLNFVPEATAILDFVKLAGGTFVAVKQVLDVFAAKKDKDDPKKLDELWKKRLTDAGLSEAKASSIVKKFSADLKKRLT